MRNVNSKPINILISGIGGYGYYYLKTIFEECNPNAVNVAGVVDPFAEKSPILPEIHDRKIPVFRTLEDFFQAGLTAALTIIASPIHFHAPQCSTALTIGSHVLCEKPLCATVQDADKLIREERSSGRWIQVGYQWTFSEAIQRLKKDVTRGLFGRPIRLKTLCNWTRDDAYYRRNDWAGKIKTDENRWILDSPANNALAHFLHNMLYISGKDVHGCALPKEITAEAARANTIENYDTIACRIITEDEAELLFYGTHAGKSDIGPIFHFEFEKSVISYGETANKIIVTNNQGQSQTYGSPEVDHQFKKLFDSISAVYKDKPLLCGLKAAKPQVLCVNGIQESVSEIGEFSAAMKKYDKARRRWWIEGLDEALQSCYQRECLPSEAGCTWTRPGKPINLINYKFFPESAIREK